MLISIDHHNGIPVFRQIIDQVKFHVVSGLLAPGDELPSTRALSGQLGLNPMTVSKAYSLIGSRGVSRAATRATFNRKTTTRSGRTR